MVRFSFLLLIEGTGMLSVGYVCSGVNSLIFEIIFPSTFPLGPPFFRILTPRFLPFIHVCLSRLCWLALLMDVYREQGGGGHVTGGGSICMDLLTSDGTFHSLLPSLISLMHVSLRLAPFLLNLRHSSPNQAGNLEPRPQAGEAGT